MAASFFIDLLAKSSRRRIRQPALLMLAGQDRIIDNGRDARLLPRSGLDGPQVIEYPDGHHTLEFEPDPSRYALDLVAWLDRTIGEA